MSSEDYLSRYFQQLAKVLAALLGYREKGKHQLVLDEIDQVLNTWFDINFHKIEKSSSDELLKLIDDHSEKSIDKLNSIAELLYQKTITLKEMGKDKEALSIAGKALALFRALDERSQNFSIEIQGRIAELDQMLAETKNN